MSGEAGGAEAGVMQEQPQRGRGIVLRPEVTEVMPRGPAGRLLDSVDQSARYEDIPVPRRRASRLHDPFCVVGEEVLEHLAERTRAGHASDVLPGPRAVEQAGHHAVKVAGMANVHEPREWRGAAM